MFVGKLLSTKAVKIGIVTILVLILLQYVVSALLYNNFNFSTLSFRPTVVSRATETSREVNEQIRTDFSNVAIKSNSTGEPVNRTIVKNKTLLVNGTSYTPVNGTLAPCKLPTLVGRIKVFVDDPPTLDDLGKEHPELGEGGRWKPKDCIAQHKMAIVIPYRNREAHLRVFLWNMHPLLQKQQLDYAIIIVEQVGTTRFNRAMLMNIGFAEGIKLYDFQCFIFHDVDLLPEDDRNIYSCPKQPRHMSVAVDKFNYRLPYADIFGGVSALTTEQFRKVNGYSNKFFGWGGEDDDMANRVKSQGYKINRYPLEIARYKMISHKNDDGNKPNEARFSLLRQGKLRFKTDGVNSLKYKLVAVELRPYCTWVKVDINEEEVMKT